jgi:hypothetical protein
MIVVLVREDGRLRRLNAFKFVRQLNSLMTAR